MSNFFIPVPRRLNVLCTCLLCLLNIFWATSLFSQSLVIESFTGPVTKNETDAFKAYMSSNVRLPEKGSGNVWVFGYAGKAVEACGLMYEATHDVEILDRMIYFCDAALAGRDDLAPAQKGGQLVVWTGKVEPVWPSGTGKPAGAGVEQGSVLAHLAFCAKLILETPAIWNKKVPVEDVNGFGATYKERALKYIREGDFVMDQWIIPRFIRRGESNHYYFPGAPNTYKAEQPAPWNQAWLLTDGFVRLTECHLLLKDAAERVAQYDAIVKPNIAWFFASCKPAVSKTGSACRIWAYALPSGLEDTNHFAYDCEGLWIAYSSGRYGIRFEDMLPFANTYFDVVLGTVTNGVFAGNVDGSTGTGHRGGDRYVRDEYLYFAEFRPELFQKMAEIELSDNKVATSAPITARLLWEKQRRAENKVKH